MYVCPQSHSVLSSNPASAPGTSLLPASLRARPSSSRFSASPTGLHALCSCSHLFYSCLISPSHCPTPRGFIFQCRPHRATESCDRVRFKNPSVERMSNKSRREKVMKGGKERKIFKSRRDRGGDSCWEMDDWDADWVKGTGEKNGRMSWRGRKMSVSAQRKLM